MFFSLQELELGRIEFDEALPPSKLDLGENLWLNAPVRTKGRAELLEEHHGRQTIRDIRVAGDYQTAVKLRCDRCLEPVVIGTKADFDLIYRPNSVDTRQEEVEISEAETEIGFYNGEGIHLEDVLKEQILLALPAKTVCREECKGLCPSCGRDLNEATCECRVERVDPRWSALEEIRKKFDN